MALAEEEVPDRTAVRKIISDWFAKNRADLEKCLRTELLKEHPKLGIEKNPHTKKTYLDSIVEDLDSYTSLHFDG